MAPKTTLEHTCATKGRFGQYAPPGECPACDALRGMAAGADEAQDPQQDQETPVIVHREPVEENVARIDYELLQVSRATINALNRQPRVRIRLPKANAGLPTQNVPPSAVVIGINGALVRVPRGVTVDVPASVYRLLEEAGYLDGSEADLKVPPPRVIEWPVGVI